jgi:ADP-glucose pyrophosphorylase
MNQMGNSGRLLKIHCTFQTMIDSLVDASATVGEKSVIKGSVIGEQTTIGERTKLFNCVIMDHVTIESGYVNVFYHGASS